MPFIITLEVGIFSLIIVCIVQIFLNQQYITNLENSMNYNIKFGNCPDYYTKRDNGTQEICSSDYIYLDKNNKQWIMKIYPLTDSSGNSIALPQTLTYNYLGGEPKYEKFPLHEIENEKTFTTYAEKCSPILQDPTDPSLAYLKGYSVVPWSSIDAKCASVISSKQNMQ